MPSPPVLDVAKLKGLPSEQQDLYLLTHVTDLHKHIAAAASAPQKEELVQQQRELVQQLLALVRIATPPPNRIVRDNIGRCLQLIFANGNRAPLYDTAADLIGIVSASNKETAQATKLAAVTVLGKVFAEAGDGLFNQCSLAVASLVKLAKSAGQHTGLRAAVYTTLSEVVRGIRIAIDEQAAKGIWKSARNAAAGDKSWRVQAAACACLEGLVMTTTYFDTHAEYDHLRSTIWKAIDSPSALVRHAAASCIAAALVKACEATLASALTQPPPKTIMKKLKRQSTLKDEDSGGSRSHSPMGLGRKADVKLSFDLPEALRQLSAQYCKTSISARTRAGIAVAYQLLLRKLGAKTVENHYSVIAQHFFHALMNSPAITLNRYRLLLTRSFVKDILEETIGRDLLHENSRLNAAKWLVNSVIKDYPQVVPERPEPSKHTLTCALSALDALIQSLGAATAAIAEPCYEALIQASQHPSYTVQIYAAHCLRSFVLVCSQQLLVCVTICMNSLTRELAQLATPRQSTRRCQGYAYALAAMLSTSRQQPLYGSVEIYAQVFDKATQLLKESSNSELRMASTQIQVAFVLLGGLMPLGPSFTKIHLGQLLKIWRNALAKPIPQDFKRGTLELSFLAHVRECALTSLWAFLRFNGGSLTADASKHIATMLHNSALFLEGVSKTRSSDDLSQRLMPSVQLSDLIMMMKRRMLQCFTKLITLEHGVQSGVLSMSNVLSLAISCIADPDVGPSGSLNATIAGTTARFEGLWEMEDGHGFGVTSLVRAFSVKDDSSGVESLPPSIGHRDALHDIDDYLRSPILRARDHDPIWLYVSDAAECTLPVPPATGVVDAAIELLSISIPLQHTRVQESTLEQVATLLSTHSLARNPGRKAAMTVNTAVMLSRALSSTSEQPGLSPARGLEEGLASQNILVEMLVGFVKSPDCVIRLIAAEGLGHLCMAAGTDLINTQVASLIDTIIDNRDPNVRAGCALALGCIHSRVGAMAASLHLKTIVGVLMSLCNDQHPVVHYSSLKGLARVAESAGLTFSAYVSGSLGMLARLYMSDSYNATSSVLATSNVESSFPTKAMVGRCLDSLINVLGPDLRDMVKATQLILTLVRQSQFEETAELVAQGARCIEHLTLFAGAQVDFKAYIAWLQKSLDSPSEIVRSSAADGLNMLMKSQAAHVMQVASPSFEEEIWLALDNAPDSTTMQGIISNWLQQTGLSDTQRWVHRLHKFLSMTRSKSSEAVAPVAVRDAAEAADEEVEGFATSIPGEDGRASIDAQVPTQQLLTWQTRNFAMLCLSELLSMVSKVTTPHETVASEQALQDCVGDVIKMAFSASTSGIIRLRVWGLKIIDQLLQMFGKTPDPDFAEASLLEQYQAQIASALTPAFAADSSPELVTEAINVCATFVGAGIVTNAERMGRIFKILVTGLEDFSQKADINEIGEFKGLNSNARVMVKLALYSAWARLQIASTEQGYLIPLVKPFIAKLAPLWLASLQEYARLRFEPEISILGSGPSSDDLDEIYAALNRETLLAFYQESWLCFLNAIASLIEKDTTSVLLTLDGRSSDGSRVVSDGVSGEPVMGMGGPGAAARPVATFFILFGLMFEALVDQRTVPDQKAEILRALHKTWHPAIAGNSVYQDAVLTETMETLDRLAMTEQGEIQRTIVEIARNLSLHHPSASESNEPHTDLREDVEQLFELARTIMLVVSGLLPGLGGEASHVARSPGREDASDLITFALDSLINVVAIFPAVIRSDLCACVLFIFMVLLRTGAFQKDAVPRALPILRRFLQGMIRQLNFQKKDELRATSLQMRGLLQSLLTVMGIAQRRENDYSLACAKNTLLTLTIVLTTGHAVLPPQDPIICQVLDQYLECLEDVGLSNIVANCLRTLLQGSNSSSPAHDVIGRYLLPRLTAFVAGLPYGPSRGALNDPENSKPIIARILVSYVTSLPPATASTNNCASIIISALLKRASDEGEATYDETASLLLEIAAAHSQMFRMLVARMTPSSKSFMEGLLRSRVAKTQERASEERESESKPSIALRMDF
ncbi:hypothetical protein KEM52_000717 [Ascosphaera acerosa]|nr:hypothetical protein KEM52_000717 [Ascosphaera acerosa]